MRKKLLFVILILLLRFGYADELSDLNNYLRKELQIIKNKKVSPNEKVEYFFSVVWKYLEEQNFSYETASFSEKTDFLEIDYYLFSTLKDEIRRDYYKKLEENDNLMEFLFTCYFELEIQENEISKYFKAHPT